MGSAKFETHQHESEIQIKLHVKLKTFWREGRTLKLNVRVDGPLHYETLYC